MSEQQEEYKGLDWMIKTGYARSGERICQFCKHWRPVEEGMGQCAKMDYTNHWAVVKQRPVMVVLDTDWEKSSSAYFRDDFGCILWEDANPVNIKDVIDAMIARDKERGWTLDDSMISPELAEKLARLEEEDGKEN